MHMYGQVHMYSCMYVHVHFQFSGKSGRPPPHVNLSRVASTSVGITFGQNIEGNGSLVHIQLSGWREGGIRKKKRRKKKPKQELEFCDSLGDSEVVRVLGNAVLHNHKMGMVQASTSGPVNARLTVPFRKQTQRGGCYARREWWVKKENNAPNKCSQLAKWAMNGRMQTHAGKGAYPAPALLFLLGSVVRSFLFPAVTLIFRLFSFGSTSQRVRRWGSKDSNPC